MVWSFVGREDIGMTFFQYEICTAILECETTVFRYNCCAETTVDTVDEGTAVSGSVCYGEVDRVAVIVGWRAVVHEIASFLWVEDFGTFRKIGGRDEFLCRYFADVWISHPPVCVAKGYAENGYAGV